MVKFDEFARKSRRYKKVSKCQSVMVSFWVLGFGEMMEGTGGVIRDFGKDIKL